jgi:hypothetical protein
MDMHFDVFVCHSTSDKGWSRSFAKSVEARGLRVFLNDRVARSDELSEETIRDALRSSASVVVVLDASSVSSPWTMFEIGAAIAAGKLILPVAASDVPVASLPDQLTALRRFRMGSAEHVAEQVARVVRAENTSQVPDKQMMPEANRREILERLRGEFIEMPGLRLTPRQAARLWNLDADSAKSLLGRLVDAGFLLRRPGGAFEQARVETPKSEGRTTTRAKTSKH